jgi:glycosyltransferase involved in cell wall biosynthesis
VRIAIAHNAWHICGGGELYLGALAEELAEHHDVALLLTTPFDRERLARVLGLHFRGVSLIKVVNPPLDPLLPYRRSTALRTELAIAWAARRYDRLVRVATARIPWPWGRRSLLHVQVPFASWPATSWRTDLNRAWNRLASARYERIFFNSRFTAAITDAASLRSGRGCVLHPPIDLDDQEPERWHTRRPIILAVGRFAEAGHCKQQLELVSAFRRMIAAGLSGWRLALVGTVPSDPVSRRYLSSVRDAAVGLPIDVYTDLARDELLRLYGEARIFWHATGLGLDEWETPESVEHFGMSTVEAMARGCIPIVIDRGGQREIVDHEVNGYRFASEDELIDYTWRVIEEGSARDRMAERARIAATAFARSHFASRVRQLIEGRDPGAPTPSWLVCPDCRVRLVATSRAAVECPACARRWAALIDAGAPSAGDAGDDADLARAIGRAMARRPGAMVLHIGRSSRRVSLDTIHRTIALADGITPPPGHNVSVAFDSRHPLPFASSTFDAVLLDIPALKGEALRVLRTGGLLLTAPDAAIVDGAALALDPARSTAGILAAHAKRPRAAAARDTAVVSVQEA